jgi:putative ABC transport system permease protein
VIATGMAAILFQKAEVRLFQKAESRFQMQATSARERCLNAPEGTVHDIRLAIRSLRATPIVTLVAILSLALGIGANTAIFSLIDSLILRSLPVAQPQRLAVISDGRAIKGGFIAGWTFGIWDQIRRRAGAFDGACAWTTERFNLAQGGGETQPVDGIYASGDYFSVLGVEAMLGRTFAAADDVPGGGKDGPVAVISYALWQRRFGGAASIVGTPLVIERVPFTIVGVMPPSFFGTDIGRAADVALPFSTEPLVRGKDSRFSLERGFYGLTVLLRLKPTQSVDDATGIMRTLQPQIREAARPSTLPPLAQKEFMKDAFTVLPAWSGISRLRTRYQQPLVAVLVVVGLVLLIACANLANLQLARAAARRHELSVRLALGASRWRLIRQWLVESLLLSSVGSALGLLFASWFSRALVAQLSTATNHVYLDLSIDWRVLAFTAAIAVATAIVFGTIPAWRAARVAPNEALKEQGRGTSGDARVNLSSGLVVAQVALSLVIVVAAGLFVRTFEKLATLPLGFDSDRVLLVNVNAARTRVVPGERLAFFDRLMREAGAVPGVATSAASLLTPVGGNGMVEMLRLSDAPASFEVMRNGKLADNASYANYITPRFFAAYGTPLKVGRDFDERDTAGAPPAIIVNETFVRKFVSGRNPIGATIAFERGRDMPALKTIVGVVGDAVYNGLRSEAVPVAYSPLAQFDFPGMIPSDMTIAVRAATPSPMRLARSVGAALTAADSDLVFTFRPMTDQVSASLTQERLVAMLAGFFGALALLLAGLGLYGVTSYAVNRRRTEIGIRMALGAAPAGVVRLVLARVTLLVGIGVLVGAGVSVWAATFVAALLYGLEPRDPLTLAGAAVVLGTVGALAAWLPAYRASRIDPAAVLRES